MNQSGWVLGMKGHKTQINSLTLSDSVAAEVTVDSLEFNRVARPIPTLTYTLQTHT